MVTSKLTRGCAACMAVDDVHGVCRTIEEVRIAKRDVIGARRNLRARYRPARRLAARRGTAPGRREPPDNAGTDACSRGSLRWNRPPCVCRRACAASRSGRAEAAPSDPGRGIAVAAIDSARRPQRSQRKSGLHVRRTCGCCRVGHLPRDRRSDRASNSPPSTSSTPSDRNHASFSGAYRPYAQIRARRLSRRAF